MVAINVMKATVQVFAATSGAAQLPALPKVYGAKLIDIDKNWKTTRAKNRQRRSEGRERRELIGFNEKLKRDKN